MEFIALENEKWVTAKTFKYDYSDEYLVSDLGRCWSIRNEKFVGHWHNGYWTVCLSKNGKPETMMVGRLILISFNIPIPEHLKDLPTSKLQAMHLDGNSENNVLENFAWGNANENANEENSLRRKSEANKGKNNPMYGKYGKEHNSSKPILQYTKSGEFVKEWSSLSDAQRELGIWQANISACARGKRRYKSAGGYVWKYKNEVA